MFDLGSINFITFTPLFLFLLSVCFVFFVIKRNFSKKIVGKDINKLNEPLVAESVGVALVVPFWLIIFSYFFFFGFDIKLLFVGFAVSVFALIGFIDDSKNKFLSKPLSWIQRALPIAFVSLIVAYLLFTPTSIFDFFGVIIVIILALYFAGIASFSNTFEGLNGWTIGSSFIITSIITLVAIQVSQELSFLFFSLNAIILGLLVFNRFPAKAFPGDSGTLLIGSSIAGFALYSQNIYFVIFVFLLFIPHMIDFFLLKMLTNRDDATQRKFRPYTLLKNGKLSIPNYPDKKTRYDFAKLIIKIFGPRREWEIVLLIWLIVLLNSVIWASIFLNYFVL
jgi:UDP-N-acetylglucosamine--dolichyl-phosphate N-acetylglucosaminephosphotransferase